MRTVCQLLHGLRVGGAEVLAARLAQQLRDRFRFVFVCLDELGTLGEQLRDEGFVVEVLGRRAGVDWRCSLRLANFLRRQRVALVHAHQYTPFFYGITARLMCHRPAVLFTEHGRHQPDYPRPKRMVANRLLLTSRDRVVGVGEAVRQALIENEGIPPRRVGVVYNGIDTEAFNGHSERASVRREIGVGDGDWMMIQVARLDYLKDHATAVRALERVLRHRPDAWLVLVGEGPEEAKVRQLARDRGVEQRVRFLGLRTDVARLLAGADLFLLSSVSEGIPVTLIEAMAARLPVVSTRVGGVAEVVEDGQTGLLAPPGDDAGLAEKILHLAADPELCRQFGQSGRERANRLFSERQMHAGYLRLYGEMLRG
ncbi:MAG: glycosyltransferase [Gemmataceae bacterium]|nr:glycosyltransferase [Gemmataceae bacterium]